MTTRRVSGGKLLVQARHDDDLRTRMVRAMLRCPWFPPAMRVTLRAALEKACSARRRFKAAALGAETRADLEMACRWHRAYVRRLDEYNAVVRRVIMPMLDWAGGDVDKANWLNYAIVCHENWRRIERRRFVRLGDVRRNLSLIFGEMDAALLCV